MSLTFPARGLLAALFLAARAANADPLSVLDGRVSCAIPAGVQAVPDAELNKLRGKPVAAYSTASRSARMTVTRGTLEKPLRLEALPALKDSIHAGLSRVFPDAQWHGSEIVTIHQRPWIRLDLSATAKDVKTRSILYVTAFDGDQLQFLFQSTGEATPDLQELVKQCGASLVVK